MFHTHCQAIEAALRAQVGDLKQELSDIHERFRQFQEDAFKRERELSDRLIAVVNPAAANAIRLTAAAVERPVVERGQVSALAGRRVVMVPPDALRTAGLRRAGVAPALTPDEDRHQPRKETPPPPPAGIPEPDEPGA